MPPSSSAQAAAVRAGRKASAVFKAVVQGPQAPAPAAWGVDAGEFRGALPWLAWRELVTFANHFGQRGTVREEIASELAAEIRRRMCPGGGAPAAGDKVSDAARAMAARSAQEPREVAAVVYSFSKLRPQSPEYLPIYDGVAYGIQQGTWKFSRLQAALVGTALADVGQHLTDALPAVVRPAVQRLCEDAQECAKVSVDELRYLVHACSLLPRPGLSVAEMDVLGNSTKRLAGQATFATAAHLMVSWLQIRPPPAAKKVHQDALRAVCAQLYSQTPQNPAHPLPVAGLAPAIADLLARERERTPPPLTPPQFRDIVQALMQISRGLRSEAACRSRSLSLNDWTEIAWLVAEFCEAHDAAGTAEEGLGSMRPLPGWAAEAMGFVFTRAHQHTPQGPASADLDTVLSLMRLLHRYRPQPQPGRSFFTWARHRVIEHYEAGSADPAALAEAVSKLVPHLPEEERSQLTHILLTSPLAPARSPLRPTLLAQARSEAAAARPSSGRLLDARSPVASGITLAGGPARAVAATVRERTPSEGAARAAAASVRERAPGKGLWGLLADDSPAGPLDPARETARAPLPAEEADAQASAVAFASPGDVSAATPRAGDAASALSDAAAPTPPAPEGGAADGVRELQARLERALQRVEALEERLQDSEQRRASEGDGRMDLMPGGAIGGSRSDCWESPAFPGGMGGTDSIGSMPGTGLTAVGGGCAVAPAPAAACLHKPFSFEEFRRAESRRLQTERLRVIVPPDHFPMWPLSKK